MKKILILICIFTLCFPLTACDPAVRSLDVDSITSNIVSIEMIDYDNPDQKTIFTRWSDRSSELLPFKESDCTLLQKLEEEKADAFLKALRKTEYYYEYYACNSPSGVCLKLLYENGDFLILNSDPESDLIRGYIGKYSAEGEVIEFYGCFSGYHSFEKLVDIFSEDDLTLCEDNLSIPD